MTRWRFVCIAYPMQSVGLRTIPRAGGQPVFYTDTQAVGRHSMPPHRWSACATCRRARGQYHRFRASGKPVFYTMRRLLVYFTRELPICHKSRYNGNFIFSITTKNMRAQKKTGTNKIDPSSYILCKLICNA